MTTEPDSPAPNSADHARAVRHADLSVFNLPDLGEGLTEAEIIEWRVTEGAEVGVDDIVVEVETAKATVEVPCPYAGTVAALHGKPGDMVAVGQPLLSIAPPADPAVRAAEAHQEEERAGSGAVLVGYGTAHGRRSARRRAARRGRSAEVSAGGSNGASAAVNRAAHVEPLAPRVISPVVRRLVREHGLELSAMTGSGPSGVILRRDVDAALERATAGTSPGDDRRAASPLREQRVPLRGVRRAVADKMARSRREIPDATTWVDVDATGLVEAREALRNTHPGIGLMALLGRFVVAGLVRFPELNASIDGAEIVQHGHVNLGFAAQTERGLLVPVVKGADQMTTVQLGDEIARLTGAARDGSLDPADLTGGTITLNNYGVFGVDGSTPIINHPEAALLGVGRIVDKAWVVDGELAVRKVTQLSLTFDHRVCDGGTAGGFLRYVADCVERPLGLLADL
ncbi:MAG TPA: dihydrolipoamide acetyltransferase family protein [Jiangellaceae bacterium]|nr:dihydrolipoamide acetyltransferase family protein [Jiangellaceae bacterium]